MCIMVFRVVVTVVPHAKATFAWDGSLIPSDITHTSKSFRPTLGCKRAGKDRQGCLELLYVRISVELENVAELAPNHLGRSSFQS